jgi:hypothetical protein
MLWGRGVVFCVRPGDHKDDHRFEFVASNEECEANDAAWEAFQAKQTRLARRSPRGRR